MTSQAETPIQAPADEEVIARILAGEKKLFEVLIRRYNQRLYRIGMSILKDEAAAEDAMQTAYINAYEHLPDFEGRSSFGTWLTRIMLNQCHGERRKQRFVFASFEQPDNYITMKTPVNELINKELSSILEQAVAQLPEKYRLVFVLREIEAMTVRETSEALDIEETNVKVRLNRAKARLREHLNGYMKDHVYAFHLAKCDRIASHVLGRLGVI